LEYSLVVGLTAVVTMSTLGSAVRSRLGHPHGDGHAMPGAGRGVTATTTTKTGTYGWVCDGGMCMGETCVWTVPG
jgi:hypothetical protein